MQTVKTQAIALTHKAVEQVRFQIVVAVTLLVLSFALLTAYVSYSPLFLGELSNAHHSAVEDVQGTQVAFPPPPWTRPPGI